ncbi:MAG: aminoacyl-tRNA hydrolase [Corallococcus sp.]|nr:aminoacyl-tRNA hydrolase [Corallococcus sp.]
MYLIVGLGNPERKYAETFHNVGFLCLDYLADKLGVTFNRDECKAVTAHTRLNGQKVILAKPLTYMNLSGQSVVQLVNKYKIPLSDLIVVYDDVDLPLGSVRIRGEGSAGTHNGMKNIVQLLGEQHFARVRVGIGKDTPMALIDYVLSHISDDDKTLLVPALKNAAEALVDFACGMQIDTVMQKHNVNVR